MQVTREKQDIVEKEFIGFPDIAADTINVLLYKGRQLTRAEDLRAGPTETVYQVPSAQTRGAKGRIRNQFEDVCKYEMTDGHIRIMYLIANQTRTDGKMLLRKAGYTGGAYREQYEGRHRISIRSSNLFFTGEMPDGEAAGSFISTFGKRSHRRMSRRQRGSILTICTFMYMRCGICRKRYGNCFRAI